MTIFGGNSTRSKGTATSRCTIETRDKDKMDGLDPNPSKLDFGDNPRRFGVRPMLGLGVDYQDYCRGSLSVGPSRSTVRGRDP